MAQLKPYSIEWYRQQPPELLAIQVDRFQRRRGTMTPMVQKQLTKIYGNITLEAAREIDRDLVRLLPTYGQYRRGSPVIFHDLQAMANEAAKLEHDVRRDDTAPDQIKAKALEKLLDVYARRWRTKWTSER